MSGSSERAAWRFLGFALLFVAAFVGAFALATLISPGNGWWAGPLGAIAVLVLWVIQQRSRRGGDADR